MKKSLVIVSLMFALSVLAACNANNIDSPYENGTRPDLSGQTIGVQAQYISTVQNSSPMCLDTASYLFERLDAIWDADGGNLWGINLHSPVVIADTMTRYAVANMPDVDGEIFTKQGNVYVGLIPEDERIASNIIYFGGRSWGMITWEAVNHTDIESTVLLILHKTFHAQQFNIFEGWPYSSTNSHMDGLDARINVMLELNALLYALRSTGETQIAAVLDAISIRAERHRLNEDADRGENSQEILEGTALYNDVVLGMDNLYDRLAFIENFIDTMSQQTMRTFGYYTGALYALLLDEFDVDWRSELSWDCDLSAILKEAIGFTRTIPFNEIDVEHYGYSKIRPVQEAWAAENDHITQKAWDAFSGSLLLIDAMGEFNENSDEAEIEVLFLQGLQLHAYDEFDYGCEDVHLLIGERNNERTVFWGNFTYTADFGMVEFTGGYLMLWRVMWRHGIPAYNIEVDSNRVIGTNWVLTLNDGFELREVGGGHFGIGSNRPAGN